MKAKNTFSHFRNTLFLFALLIALGCFIYYFDRHMKTSAELRDQADHVVEVNRDTVTAVSIKNPESEIKLQETRQPMVS